MAKDQSVGLISIDPSRFQDTVFTFTDGDSGRFVTINMTEGTVESNISPDEQVSVIVDAMKRFAGQIECERCGR